jgi:hypothetical protein
MATLYVALGGGWWKRERPPAPEQTFEAATGQTKPLAEAHAKRFSVVAR